MENLPNRQSFEHISGYLLYEKKIVASGNNVFKLTDMVNKLVFGQRSRKILKDQG